MRKSLSALIFSFLLIGNVFAAPTKSTAAVDEWAEVAQNTVREGATTDISGNYDSVLTIAVALSTTTAHTGSKVEVQISSNTTGDEDWITFTEFITCVGTAAFPAIDTSEAIGQTVIGVAATTGYFDDDETRWVFIEDANTVADSELGFLVSHDAGVSITLQDGITVAKDTSDHVSDVAEVFTIQLPLSAYRVRIIYDNTYDSNGSTVHTYSRISKTTGL